jgi:ribonuclease HII
VEILKPYFLENAIEVGCDEAGRGCLAGPVFAAAVILPKDFYHPLLNDSKLLTEKIRYELRPIIEKKAIAWSVGICTPKEIDQINILNASFKAMHKALNKLQSPFDHILVDGNRFNKYKKIKHTCVVKGDSEYASIAAASILAKTYRDDYMIALDKKNKKYFWCENKGYPTKQHRAAIEQFGATAHHRMTFQLLAE